jgi:hypothetical protein
MIVRRIFIRSRVVRGRYHSTTYSGRKVPNAAEHCTGWYLFGLVPLFISVERVEYFTDIKP